MASKYIITDYTEVKGNHVVAEFDNEHEAFEYYRKNAGPIGYNMMAIYEMREWKI